jgi:hypothetical protein
MKLQLAVCPIIVMKQSLLSLILLPAQLLFILVLKDKRKLVLLSVRTLKNDPKLPMSDVWEGITFSWQIHTISSPALLYSRLE